MAAETKLPRSKRPLTDAHRQFLRMMAEQFVEQLYSEPEETHSAVDQEEEMSR